MEHEWSFSWIFHANYVVEYFLLKLWLSADQASLAFDNNSLMIIGWKNFLTNNNKNNEILSNFLLNANYGLKNDEFLSCF